MLYLVSIFMYLMGVLSFSLNRKHLLMLLLNLEFIVLALYMNLFLFLTVYSYEFYFSMIFLTISVCEGALGLSILVSLIRTHGNDYFQSFNILW
uniref:NADH-ubiquinone oxidoreductase chain 4L n=1 Tax=Hydrophilidae sp. BMNH 1274336 TaxID=1796516 RepID=A0A126TFK0_9COLE|nr:NADH dehydrogenase subunit 4L [Hydrophilidae sp. BMNH 1274336]